jgi:hypothetical protein
LVLFFKKELLASGFGPSDGLVVLSPQELYLQAAPISRRVGKSHLFGEHIVELAIFATVTGAGGRAREQG